MGFYRYFFALSHLLKFSKQKHTKRIRYLATEPECQVYNTFLGKSVLLLNISMKFSGKFCEEHSGIKERVEQRCRNSYIMKRRERMNKLDSEKIQGKPLSLYLSLIHI